MADAAMGGIPMNFGRGFGAPRRAPNLAAPPLRANFSLDLNLDLSTMNYGFRFRTARVTPPFREAGELGISWRITSLPSGATRQSFPAAFSFVVTGFIRFRLLHFPTR